MVDFSSRDASNEILQGLLGSISETNRLVRSLHPNGACSWPSSSLDGNRGSQPRLR